MGELGQSYSTCSDQQNDDGKHLKLSLQKVKQDILIVFHARKLED